MLRGVRFWCCPRRKSHPGCGRTFCILLGGMIPGYSVPAATLACFFLAWSRLQGDVLAAWQEARTGYSTDSAYRWVKRLLRNQGEVRTRLCRARAPPPTRGAGILADLFEHLDLVLGSENFIEAFIRRSSIPNIRMKKPKQIPPRASTLGQEFSSTPRLTCKIPIRFQHITRKSNHHWGLKKHLSPAEPELKLCLH